MSAEQDDVQEGIDAEQEAEQEIDQEIEQEAEQDAPEQVNPIEVRAVKMGWVPKDDFRGDPNSWRPAEEFVERGEMLIPILNKKIRNLERQQSDKDKTFKTYLDDMRDKLHSQKVDEYEARKRQAVDEGDTEAYDRLARDVPKNDLPEYQPPEPQGDPLFDEWVMENDWYKSDYEKNQEAENYGKFLRTAQPDLQGRDFLDEVTKHVRTKFSNPNRQKPSAVDGETQKANQSPGKRYNSLEAEAKAVFNQFVREGIFKNTHEDREAYAKDVQG